MSPRGPFAKKKIVKVKRSTIQQRLRARRDQKMVGFLQRVNEVVEEACRELDPLTYSRLLERLETYLVACKEALAEDIERRAALAREETES